MKEETRREHNPIQGSSEEALGKAAQLAPPEERAKRPGDLASNVEGVLATDTGNLKLPKDFTERREEKSGLLDVEPITILILIFSLAFIGVMAYLISIDPS